MYYLVAIVFSSSLSIINENTGNLWPTLYQVYGNHIKGSSSAIVSLPEYDFNLWTTILSNIDDSVSFDSIVFPIEQQHSHVIKPIKTEIFLLWNGQLNPIMYFTTSQYQLSSATRFDSPPIDGCFNWMGIYSFIFASIFIKLSVTSVLGSTINLPRGNTVYHILEQYPVRLK